MLEKRIIPVLLLRENGLVKGIKFRNYRYIGDPMNAIKIFNDKKVDELIFLDINATNNNKSINHRFVEQIADDRDQSKNSMKFPVTSLFKSDSRGTVSGTHVGVWIENRPAMS